MGMPSQQAHSEVHAVAAKPRETIYNMATLIVYIAFTLKQ